MAVKKNRLKLLLLVAGALLMLGAGVYWFIATEKFADTSDREAHYTVSATDFIKEFEADYLAANEKYADRIITVNGRVSQIENADTAVNVKFIDTTTGSYIIFAFQDNDVKEARKLKDGDSTSIKGSFSSGLFSEILETTFITFKRSVINKS